MSIDRVHRHKTYDISVQAYEATGFTVPAMTTHNLWRQALYTTTTATSLQYSQKTTIIMNSNDNSNDKEGSVSSKEWRETILESSFSEEVRSFGTGCTLSCILVMSTEAADAFPLLFKIGQVFLGRHAPDPAKLVSLRGCNGGRRGRGKGDARVRARRQCWGFQL